MSKFARDRIALLAASGVVYNDADEWAQVKDIVSAFQEEFGELRDGDKVYAEDHELCHNYIVIGGKLYQINNELGAGGFGYVKRVVDEHGQQFALKVNGLKLTVGVAHPYLVSNEKTWLLAQDKLLGTAKRVLDRPSGYGETHYAFTPLKKRMLVKDYSLQPVARGVNLNKIISDHKNGIRRLSEADKYKIALAITKAVANFHQTYNAVHRDLKPDNIFYDWETDQAELIDFGLTQEVGEDLIPGGTSAFTPPECKDFYKIFRTRVDKNQDVYALGRVLDILGVPFRILRNTQSEDPGARPLLGEVQRILEAQSHLPVSVTDDVARVISRPQVAEKYQVMDGIPCIDDEGLFEPSGSAEPAGSAELRKEDGAKSHVSDGSQPIVAGDFDSGEDLDEGSQELAAAVVSTGQKITPLLDAKRKQAVQTDATASLKTQDSTARKL